MVEYCKVFNGAKWSPEKGKSIEPETRLYVGANPGWLEKRNAQDWADFCPDTEGNPYTPKRPVLTGKSKREKVGRVREYLLEEDWLDFIFEEEVKDRGQGDSTLVSSVITL